MLENAIIKLFSPCSSLAPYLCSSAVAPFPSLLLPHSLCFFICYQTRSTSSSSCIFSLPKKKSSYPHQSRSMLWFTHSMDNSHPNFSQGWSSSLVSSGPLALDSLLLSCVFRKKWAKKGGNFWNLRWPLWLTQQNDTHLNNYGFFKHINTPICIHESVWRIMELDRCRTTFHHCCGPSRKCWQR